MSKIKYVTPKDAADLAKIQGTAVRGVNRGRSLVQVALVATMLHAGKHNDWSSANDFVTALGNSVNGRAIVEWFQKFMGLKIAEDNSGFGSWSGPDHIKANLEEAKATMWWELKIASPFKGYSLEQALQGLIKKHESVMGKVADDPEAAKLVSVEVNDSTIRQVLALCNFDAIVSDAGNTDKIADELPEGSVV